MCRDLRCQKRARAVHQHRPGPDHPPGVGSRSMAAATYPPVPASATDPDLGGASAMVLTYRYRLLATRQQHTALLLILEAQRQLYNAALAERIDAYRRSLLQVERGLRPKPQSITYFDQTNSLTQCQQALPDMA